MRAEVGGNYIRIFADLCASAFGQFLAVIKHQDAVGEVHHHLHVVLDQHHRDTGIGDLAHQMVDLDGFLGVEAGGRLVEEDQARLHGQGAGDFETLERAVGHAVGTGLGKLFETDEAHQLKGFLAHFIVAAPQCRQTQGGLDQVTVQSQMGANHDVLDGAHVHADLQVLESPGDTARRQFIGGFAANRLAIQLDLAGSWFINAGNQVEQRRLARPVGADHRIDDTGVDIEADILYSLDAAEVNGEIANFE